MRGYRIPKSSRKLDVVIVASRYTPRSKQLKLGQAYIRRGPIWGDQVLLDRKAIIEHLKAGRRVVTGKPTEIPGVFEVFKQVRMDELNGKVGLHVGVLPEKGDELGLPLF